MNFAFANPDLAVIATAAIALGFFFIRFMSRKRISRSMALTYSQSETHRMQIHGSSKPSTEAPGAQFLRVLRALALILLALALARPQKVMVEELEPVEGVDVMLAIDTSSSMQAVDFDPLNRLQAAKKIATDFVRKRKGDRLGLVSFGGSAILNCPPTLDHQAVRSFLNQVEIGMTQTQGTAIGSGLMTALTHLRRVPSKSKVIVLLTDGRNNAGSVDPVTASKVAESMGVKIYSIGAGKRGGGLFPVRDPIFGTRYVRVPGEEIDEEMLTKISEATGGKYWRAQELQELKNIFNEIDRLEKTEIDAPRQVHYEELYPLLLLAALLILGAEVLMRSTWMFTLP